MKFRIMSDLHMDVAPKLPIVAQELMDEFLPPLPEDRGTVLLLAGDIGGTWLSTPLEAFLRIACSRFMHVSYIPGNHEYYHKTIDGVHKDLAIFQMEFTNLSVGEKLSEPLDEDNTERRWLHAATLWTDFDVDRTPKNLLVAQKGMNDYRMIYRADKSMLEPADILQRHYQHRDFLRNIVGEGDVVMTHHAPSMRSISPAYKGDMLNMCFATDLEEHLILARKPKLWVHGHVHTANDYMVGDTRVVCNPVGYYHERGRTGYNPTLVIDV